MRIASRCFSSVFDSLLELTENLTECVLVGAAITSTSESRDDDVLCSDPTRFGLTPRESELHYKHFVAFCRGTRSASVAFE